jgi:anti-sigma B factor antagonist
MAHLGDGDAQVSVAVSVDESGSPIVHLAGELDMSNVDAVSSELADLIDDDPERLVFDLADLTFMDSSGLALLLHAAHHAETLEVRRPTEVVRRVIDATGLADTLGMRPA